MLRNGFYLCDKRVPYRVFQLHPYRNAHTVSTTSRDAGVDANVGVPTLDVNDYKSAFKYRRVSELFRSLFVLRICSYDVFIRNSLKLMTVSERLLGQRLYKRLMKATFYGQFVGGETASDLQENIQALQKIGIGPLLLASIEEDKGQSGDRNQIYDANLETVLNVIQLVKDAGNQHPMSQLKLTALVPGDLCATISEKIPSPYTDTRNVNVLSEALAGNSAGLEFLGLGPDDTRVLARAIERVKTVGEFAQRLDVHVLVDAEYTYLNPALRLISLAMMITFNKQRPLIAYTYQNYLKEMFETFQEDEKFIRAKNSCFGAKIVRGAYIVKERKLAAEQGYPDPVHDTFEDTTTMYNQSMEYLLDKIQTNPNKYFIIIASHNERTALHGIEQMSERHIPPKNNAVFFGQVYGMSDYLSAALVKSGYQTYKSIPVGSIQHTLPYLHRRAMENSSILGETRKEREMLWSAFLNRATLGALPLKQTR